MSVLLVAQYLTEDGPELAARLLLKHISTQCDVRVTGAIIENGSELLTSLFGESVTSFAVAMAAEAIIVEGGWNQDHGFTRVPQVFAEEYVRRGGALVIADIDKKTAASGSAALASASSLLGSVPKITSRGIPYLRDVSGQRFGGTQIFRCAEMQVSSPIEATREGVDGILTWGAIPLDTTSEVLASTSLTAQVLLNDRVVEQEGVHFPWATVHEYGAGHVAIIAASVTKDFLVERNPDNARWVRGIIDSLVNRSWELIAWRKSQSDFTTDKLRASPLEQEEGQQHERKSSFLTPTDPTRADVNRKLLQDQVGKSIAALANTDGGSVVIGQADDGNILGLEADFQSLGKLKNKDGFEQSLVQYVSNVLRPGWEYIGLRLSWIERDSKWVAVVQVPSCPRPVHLDYQGAKEAIFVRRGTRTDRLEGRALTEWLTGPRFSS